MKSKERQSNFELMRIISMFLIVVWHVIFHGHIFEHLGEPSQFVSNLIVSLIVVHVNSLVFLTGYFNSNKKEIKTSKPLKLAGTAWFYKAAIVLIFIFFNILKLTKVEIVQELLPLDMSNYWFINCYIVLYLFTPYLNKATDGMNERQFFKFLLLQILLLSIFPLITNNVMVVNNGSSIINFVIIYYLGSYFRKFPIKDNFHFKYINKKQLRLILLSVFLFCALINLSIYYLADTMTNVNSRVLDFYGNIMKNNFNLYSNPLVIIQSVAYCLLFETLNIKSKIINYISGSVLGIYLIHDNHLMRKVIYDLLIPKTRPVNMSLLILLLKASIIIFISCLLIESIRRLLVKIIVVLYNKIVRKKVNGEK